MISLALIPQVKLVKKSGSDDLATLSELSEDTLLSELSQRYGNEQIYVSMHTLLSV